MKISPLHHRTATNPTVGVTFSPDDRAKIVSAAKTLTYLNSDTLYVMRTALGRHIMYLEELGDWVSGEAAELRYSQLESALIAYQATFEARVTTIASAFGRS